VLGHQHAGRASGVWATSGYDTYLPEEMRVIFVFADLGRYEN
jgi:hypothetical protein